MIDDWYKKLNSFEKRVFEVSKLTKGIYWTKQQQFSGGKAYYSDFIKDYYWTLVVEITTSQEKVGRLIKETANFFNKLQKQYSFYIYPSDRNRGVEDWLKEAGYKMTIEDTWMFLENDQQKLIKPLNPKIEVKEVKNSKDNEVYINTYASAYETNPDDVYFDFSGNDTYQRIYRKTWKDKDLRKKIHRFVAYFDGNPGSMGALYFRNGLGYISEVGTDPKFRNKGLATAISLTCIDIAKKEGCNTICLTTEKNGPAFDLYKKLNFSPKVICRGWSK